MPVARLFFALFPRKNLTAFWHNTILENWQRVTRKTDDIFMAKYLFFLPKEDIIY